MKQKPSEIKAAIVAATLPWMHLSDSFLTPSQQKQKAEALFEVERLRDLKSEIVQRVSEKLKRIKTHFLKDGRGLEYDQMRYAGRFDKISHLSGMISTGREGDLVYTEELFLPETFVVSGFLPGGMWAQNEDDREIFLDKVIVNEEI